MATIDTERMMIMGTFKNIVLKLLLFIAHIPTNTVQSSCKVSNIYTLAMNEERACWSSERGYLED